MEFQVESTNDCQWFNQLGEVIEYCNDNVYENFTVTIISQGKSQDIIDDITQQLWDNLCNLDDVIEE